MASGMLVGKVPSTLNLRAVELRAEAKVFDTLRDKLRSQVGSQGWLLTLLQNCQRRAIGTAKQEQWAVSSRYGEGSFAHGRLREVPRKTALGIADGQVQDVAVRQSEMAQESAVALWALEVGVSESTLMSPKERTACARSARSEFALSPRISAIKWSWKSAGAEAAAALPLGALAGADG